MTNIHLERGLTTLFGLALLIWFILIWISNIDRSNFFAIIKQLPNVVTAMSCVTVIFLKWLWKLPVFKHWLVFIPDLNGTWIGELQSTWVDPISNEQARPIKTMLTISQTLFTISCVMQTGEMKSYSSAEGFEVDKERQIKRLAYIYTSKPGQLVQHRSSSHDGAIIFDILVGSKKLVGEYWTSRKTAGTVELKFYSKELLEELPA